MCFCLFALSTGFPRQECWSGLPFPSSGPHFARSLPQGLELEVLHQDVGRAVPPWEAPGENPSSPLPLPGSRHSPWLHRSSFCLCLHMAFSASVSSFPSPVKTLQIRQGPPDNPGCSPYLNIFNHIYKKSFFQKVFTFYLTESGDLDTDRSLEGVTTQLAVNIRILEYLLCQKVIKNPKIDGDVSKEHR